MPEFKIALCFSDTGGGHRSAADAIEAGIKKIVAGDKEANSFVVSMENIVENTHPINRAFVNFYNFLLRHNQAAMQYYFWFIETFKPNNSELGYKLIRNNLANFIKDRQPHVIVSVHPMCNHYLAKAIRDTGNADKIKLVTVVTDPNTRIWNGWACRQADITIVPNEPCKKQLINLGVSETKIQVIGMPIHPDFCEPPSTSKGEFLHHLGLHRDWLTICINAGWAGGGDMISIYRALCESTKQLQIIFLCGYNKPLYEKMKREAYKSQIPLAVLPFHDRMSDLMNAVDLMVTKAGGLTTFEAIARRLPLVFDTMTCPMPQEVGTIQMLVKENLALAIKKPNELLPIVDRLLPDPDRSNRCLPSSYNLNRIDAVFDIARTVLSFCDRKYSPISQTQAIEHR